MNKDLDVVSWDYHQDLEDSASSSSGVTITLKKDIYHLIQKAEKMKIELKGCDAIEKSVRAYGKSGGLPVPKIWVGGEVQVILIEDEHYEEEYTQGKRQKRMGIPSKKELYHIYSSESIRKSVLDRSGGVHIYLPQKWIGKRVKIILLENPLIV